MNKMKAIIKQFFLHGVGNRFFQLVKSIFKFKIFKNELDKKIKLAITYILFSIIFSFFVFWIKCSY